MTSIIQTIKGKNRMVAHPFTHREYRGCLRKVKYPTREAAKKKGYKPYKCGYCSQWHRASAR